MDAAGRMEIVRRLCSFEGRWPGTDAERRAANELAGLLKGTGRRVRVETTYVRPEYALAHALHAGLVVVGSVVSVYVGWLGFAVLLVTAASIFGDLTTRFHLARRLFFRRASQNVVSPGGWPDAPGRVVVCANYDAARTGWLFEPRRLGRLMRLQRRSRLPLHPFALVFWGAIAVLLPAAGLRMAGVEGTWLTAIQLVPTALAILAVPVLVDIALSRAIPGANDNASGVATALSLAEELDRDPPANLDVWVVLPGAGESLAEGMRSFVRTHRKQLDRRTTWFVNLEAVGRGDVRYTTAEGHLVAYHHDARLVELCDAIATADREGAGRYGAEPLRHSFATDALPPRIAGYPAITIACREAGNPLPHAYNHPTDTPDRLDPEALTRAHDFALDLIRQIDRDLGRRRLA